MQFWGPSLRKLIQVRYESGYLFRTPPRALEGARASQGPRSLIFLSFTVNPPLLPSERKDTRKGSRRD